MYGFTSDAEGIRHALLEESTLPFTDAKVFLIQPGSFVTYILGKQSQGKIKASYERGPSSAENIVSINRWESFLICLRLICRGGNELGFRAYRLRHAHSRHQADTPGASVFTPNKKSNWRTSQAGYRVHGLAVDTIWASLAEEALSAEI